jgi:hypothetical protein
MDEIDVGAIDLVEELNLTKNTRYTFNSPCNGKINPDIEYQGIFKEKKNPSGTVYYIFTDVYIENKKGGGCSHVDEVVVSNPKIVEKTRPKGGGKSRRRHRKSTRRHRKSRRR